jgi:hypothetical protein
MNIDFAQSAADLLRVSLALAVEGRAMHNVIKASLAYHTAFLVEHPQKLEMSGNAARKDA